VDDYAERLQQLAENLTVPPDDMFMLSNFRAGLLEYLQVAMVGLRRQTFSEAVDSARTTEEGLPKTRPPTPPTNVNNNPWRNIRCTSCGRMGYEWMTCFKSGKRVREENRGSHRPPNPTTYRKYSGKYR
jgi:hypothetical protein